MSSIIDTLKQLRERNQLPNYIEYVKFPAFKSIERNTRIDFDFPFTALLGGNGTRKSSVLKGIQGCPLKQSPQKYWFSTSLDPISDDGEKRTSIIHGYKNERGEIVECLKLRARKRGRTWDYWETARPAELYGMEKGDRQEPVNKPVLYFNFRSLLPAFDKCFFYSDRNNVQDYIRNRTALLNSVLDSRIVRTVRGKKQNEPCVTFSTQKLECISNILGRKYVEGKYLRHKFFDGWADTVRFQTEHHSYSEAFAGSGETAVAILVHKIEEAVEGTLIILDEPEVSLHPEAQRRLKEYLLKKIKFSKHQVIISTHSPFMVDGLPSSAIKAFRISPETGRTEVIPNITPLEAFSVIGYEPPLANKKVIWVEDLLAKNIIEQAIGKRNAVQQSVFEIRVIGSDSQMYKDIVHAVGKPETENYFFCLDGDNSPLLSGIEVNERGLCIVDSIREKDMNNDFLADIIKGQSKQQGPDRLGLNRQEDLKLRINAYKSYLKFMERNVFFLPGRRPEELIWSDELAKSSLECLGFSISDIDRCMEDIRQNGDHKKKFKIYCDALYQGQISGSEIFVEQRKFVTKFINSTAREVALVDEMLTCIAEA